MEQNLQELIDTGGPEVKLPPGRHTTGTIELKSHMTLHVPPGSEILGSLDRGDYPCEFTDMVRRQHHSPALIVGEDLKNVTIEGGGIINGRGDSGAFPALKSGDEMDRPMLLRFNNCKNVYIRDVQFRNSASWGLHFINCENVHIDGITMESQSVRNNDGLDLDGCRDVFISNCRLNTGDDAICPKSTFRPTENVVITNCILSSRTAALKLGTSSAGGFRNITMTNCVCRDCLMGTIKLQCVDGGILENIFISNIVMDNVEGPLFIRLGCRGIDYRNEKDAETLIYSASTTEEEIAGQVPPGILRNITISDIRARVVTDDPARSGIMITGIPGHRVENVLLKDVHISFPGGVTADESSRKIAEDANRYPEQFFFGVLPSWGAYVRHARNIEFRNVRLECRKEDSRQRIVREDVEEWNE